MQILQSHGGLAGTHIHTAQSIHVLYNSPWFYGAPENRTPLSIDIHDLLRCMWKSLYLKYLILIRSRRGEIKHR